MHIHTDARTRQMYVHMSYTRAGGVSKTVIKGDGNSRPVGSQRRDREDVVCRRPVRPKDMPKKNKKKVIATFRIPEHSIADFFTLSRLSLNSLSARGVVGGEDLGCKQTSVSFFANLSIA
jgi:hypothetical protein